MTSLDQLNDDFKDLLRCLCAESAEFLIVGAYALAFHGLPRATGDIDIFIRPTPENAARVHRALSEFGAPLSSSGVSEADWTSEDMIYQIGVPPRRVDILTGISGSASMPPGRDMHPPTWRATPSASSGARP